MTQETKSSLGKVIKIRISAAEELALKETAAEAGISVSELLRKSGRGATVTSNSDRQTVRELRRLGGLMKKIHLDSRGAYSSETANAINAIAGFIDGIAS